MDSPEIFGLNPNADIAFRTKETKELISIINDTRPKESDAGSGMTREEQVQKRAWNLLKQIVYFYDIENVKKTIQKLEGPKSLGEKGFRVPLNIFLY